MPRLTKIAKLAVEALQDLKGVDIKVLDVKPLTPIADFMIVCTGTSNRHVKSLASSVIEKSKHAGHQPSGVEGMEMGEWVLVNLGEVIVHVMQLQARAFYQLEKLWDLPPPVSDAEQSAKPRRAKASKAAKSAKSSKSKKPAKSSAKSAKPAKRAAAKPKSGGARKPRAKRS